jgi:hypothetical protein
MALIQDLREMREVARAREQRPLNFLLFAPDEVVADVRHRWFSTLPHTMEWYFVRRHRTLASIAHGEESTSTTIYLHSLLNHADTPPEVFAMIIKHEFLHLVVPPAMIDGKRVNHPPEFWQQERAIAPERDIVWRWIWKNLWPCLRNRPAEERIDVTREWASLWAKPRMSLAECAALDTHDGEASNKPGTW